MSPCRAVERGIFLSIRNACLHCSANPDGLNHVHALMPRLAPLPHHSSQPANGLNCDRHGHVMNRHHLAYAKKK